MISYAARLLLTSILLAFTLLVLTLTAAPSTSSAASQGTNYYVSPTGSDSNAGNTSNAPLKTIQKAFDAAQPGDTINLAAGTYMQDVLTKRNGTKDAPITVTGPATAIIQGGGNGRIFEVNHDYLVLNGFTIDGQYSPGAYRDKLLYVHGIETRDGVTGLKVQHLTLRNAGGECMRLRYFVQQSEISDTVVGPCGRDDFPNGVYGGGAKNGEGIYVGTAPEQRGDGKNPTADPDLTTDNWIHDNTFNTQGNECVDIKEAATRNLVEHNTCTGQKDSESGGFDARGSGNTFRYNEVYGNLGAGVRLGGDANTDGINNNVYENTIHDNKSGGIKFQRAPQARVCSNMMTGNTGGNAVGDFSTQFNPAAACTNAPPASAPSITPTPSIINTATTAAVNPSATATRTATASPSATTQPISDQTVYAALADTYINSASPNKSYGPKSTLKIDQTPETWTLIRFQLPAGQPVTRALLRLYVKDGGTQGGHVSIASGSWDERSTWRTRPTQGAVLGTIGKASQGKYVTIDVTGAIQADGSVSLVIVPQSKDAVTYASREGDQGKGPQLIVER